MNAYTIGQSVRLRAEFSDLNEAPYDPSTVTFSYRQPSGTVTELVYGADASVVRDGVGVYHADIIPNAAGEWRYRAEGVGGGQAADEGAFMVTASEVK